MIYKKPKTQNPKPKTYFGGFTMIELLVATGLFLAVISIATGVFIQSLRTQRAITALMAANDNASLAIEQISREIRTGSLFRAENNGQRLVFVDQQGQGVIYEFDGEQFIKRNGEHITGRNVKVNYLKFILMGAELNDGQSTRVTIILGVSATNSVVADIINHLQTTISSRQLDA